MCVFHMVNFHLFATYPHRQYVDTVLDSGTTMSGHPDQRRAAQLLELIEVDGAGRAAKVEVASRLYLDERYRLVLLDYEVKVPMAVLEPVLQDPPAALAEPFRGDAFAEQAKGMGLRHAAMIPRRSISTIIGRSKTLARRCGPGPQGPRGHHGAWKRPVGPGRPPCATGR